MPPEIGGLPYLEMAPVARFLAAKVSEGDTADFDTFFDSVERCIHEGDEAVTLVMVGLLEALQNYNVTELENETWIPYLKPTTRRAWQAVEDFWNGDHYAISRFSVRPSDPGGL
jgi:hypothetical protein